MKVGVVLGGLVLLFIVIFIIWYLRRRRNNPMLSRLEPIAYPHEKNTVPEPATAPAREEIRASAHVEIFMPGLPVDIIPESEIASPPGTRWFASRPAIQESPSVVSTEPPPEYNTGTSIGSTQSYAVPPVSAALAEFASSNRRLISEDLEARLTAAGYLPTDDPDNLSEEEWRDVHNVTKLELMRIRALYAGEYLPVLLICFTHLLTLLAGNTRVL